MKKETQAPHSEKHGNHVTIIKGPTGRIIRKRIQTFNAQPSMTEQQFAQDADANYIMAKYLKTGVDPFVRKQGFYADVSQVPDLSQALQIVTQAQTAFDSLDSEVRARFGNSPELMIQFLQDSENRDEAIKLGLINKPEEEPAPISVRVMAEPTASTPPESKT